MERSTELSPNFARKYPQSLTEMSHKHSGPYQPHPLDPLASLHMSRFTSILHESAEIHRMPGCSCYIPDPIFQDSIVFKWVLDILQSGIIMIDTRCSWSQRKRWMCFWNFPPKSYHSPDDLSEFLVSPYQCGNISRMGQETRIKIWGCVYVVAGCDMNGASGLWVMIPKSCIYEQTGWWFQACVVWESVVSIVCR